MTNNRRINQPQQGTVILEKIMGKARCQSALSDEVRNAMPTSLMKRDEQTATPRHRGIRDILQPVAVANNPNCQPFNSEALLTKVNDNRFKLTVFWQQFDFITLLFQTFNGNFVINTRDNDLTITYIPVLCTASRSPSIMPISFIDIPLTRSRKSAFGLNREGST